MRGEEKNQIKIISFLTQKENWDAARLKKKMNFNFIFASALQQVARVWRDRMKRKWFSSQTRSIKCLVMLTALIFLFSSLFSRPLNNSSFFFSIPFCTREFYFLSSKLMIRVWLTGKWFNYFVENAGVAAFDNGLGEGIFRSIENSSGVGWWWKPVEITFGKITARPFKVNPFLCAPEKSVSNKSNKFN